jgi:predicted transcriptional regulator
MIMDDNLTKLTAEMFIAYVTNNKVEPGQISQVVRAIGHGLSGQFEAAGNRNLPTDKKPAVPIDESVTPEYIVCLEDGKQFKSMKRHLGLHGMTPDEYRARWGLSADYPIVAPKYAKARSRLAKKIGLGRKSGAKK